MIPTWLVALMAGGAAAYAQIRSALQWLISIVLVNIKVSDFYNLNFIPYMDFKYKKLSFGDKLYSFNKYYVKKKYAL